MNRVWIYQADRFLTDGEVADINRLLQDFVAQWAAHGSALAGKGSVRHNLFLVLEVDERQVGVTGCSIDSSVYFIKGLEQRFSVGFFDRMKVAFRDDNGEVQLVDRNDFAALVSGGQVNEETIVFNNLIQSSEELETRWERPFKYSWHHKVFV